MAFGVAPDAVVSPQYTTVSSYSISRLGNPVLRVRYAETALQWITIPIDLAEDLDSDGHYETLHTTDSNVAVGVELFDTAGNSVGVVTSYSNGVATLVGPAMPTSAPASLCIPLQNAFGAQIQKLVPRGREYELQLAGDNAQQSAKMQALLIEVTVNMAMLVFAQMNHTATVEDVQAAVIALAQAGNNIDSIIGTVMEGLEISRRAGELPYVTTVGAAPAPTLS
jgi:hypothetical protein